MYCPRCSQQQASEEASFCSRCGFQLGVVKGLLATDGALPGPWAGVQMGQGARRFRRGVRVGLKMIFFSIVLLPLFFGVCIIFDSPGPLLPPAALFLAGLASILYTVIFGEELLPTFSKAQPTLPGPSAPGAKLSPPAGVTVNELGAARHNTAEMMQPPSVTERTTNLLRKNKS